MHSLVRDSANNCLLKVDTLMMLRKAACTSHERAEPAVSSYYHVYMKCSDHITGVINLVKKMKAYPISYTSKLQ